MTDLNAPTDPKDIPEEWLIERMRNERNRLLAASDWTMLTDAQVARAEWVTYRQALRDFPATWKPALKVNFPTPPNQTERSPK